MTTSKKILKALNFFVPTLGTAASWITSVDPKQDGDIDPSMRWGKKDGKPIIYNNNYDLNSKIHRNAGVLIAIQTGICATLMAFSPFGKDYNLTKIPGMDDTDALILSCVLAFVVMPWIIKAITGRGTLWYEGEKVPESWSSLEFALLGTSELELQSNPLPPSGPILDPPLNTPLSPSQVTFDLTAEERGTPSPEILISRQGLEERLNQLKVGTTFSPS